MAATAARPSPRPGTSGAKKFALYPPPPSNGTSSPRRPPPQQQQQQQQQQHPRTKRPSIWTSWSSSSSTRTASGPLLYVAVVLYVTALSVYFALGFAFLNRYWEATTTTTTTTTTTEDPARGGGEGALAFLPGARRSGPLGRDHGFEDSRVLLPQSDAGIGAPGGANENENENSNANNAPGGKGLLLLRGGSANKGEDENPGGEGPARRAVPLVARRDARGKWHPAPSALNASLTTIRRAFFDANNVNVNVGDFDGNSSSNNNSNNNYKNKRNVLGVVRITKTGSTSLLSFLSASRASQSFDHSLTLDPKAKMDGDRVVPYCFYEPNRRGRGGNPNHLPPRPRPAPAGAQCGHRTYARMISILVRQLSSSYRDEEVVDDEEGGERERGRGAGGGGGGESSALKTPRAGAGAASSLPVELSLSIITMLRDPYDRMLSFFNYFREIYPDWAPMYKAQPQVLQALLDGNFPAFLQELALLEGHEWTRRYQYEYFGRDVGEAIRVVDEVRVLPLLNECFNASALLLAHQYPDLFPMDQPAATHRFLESGRSHARKTGAAKGADRAGAGAGAGAPPKPPPLLLHPDLRPVQDMDAERTRAQARETWLKDEYKFYDAAKKVLGRMLREASTVPGSIVDATDVHQCLDRIGLRSSSLSSSSTSSKVAWAAA